MTRSGEMRARDGRVLPLVLGAVLIGAIVVGALPRLRQARARTVEVAAAGGTSTVYTERVVRDTLPTLLEMPGSVMGLHETPLYARANGFVRVLRVDIGSRVVRGETLVVLDQPEVREQLRQAQAALEQSEASAALARSTLARWQSLRAQDVVTPQELDERQAAAQVAQANVRVARANVASLSEVARFGVLTAPFNGVVTARGIDVGSLVTAGAAVAARPLLTVVQTDTLRVMLNVPQSAAMQVRVGQSASVVIAGAGDSAYTGRVVRTAQAIDAVTRTLLTEVHLPNRDRRLLPGTSATVRLSVPSAGAGLRIPAIALIIRADGPQVAQVVDGRVTLVPVVLGRDFGTSIEVLGGIAEGADLVVNPSEQLSSGTAVTALPRATGSGKAAATPPPRR